MPEPQCPEGVHSQATRCGFVTLQNKEQSAFSPRHPRLGPCRAGFAVLVLLCWFCCAGFAVLVLSCWLSIRVDIERANPRSQPVECLRFVTAD
jgi:hypothetical protein